jgi:hypothetical protein
MRNRQNGDSGRNHQAQIKTGSIHNSLHMFRVTYSFKPATGRDSTFNNWVLQKYLCIVKLLDLHPSPTAAEAVTPQLLTSLRGSRFRAEFAPYAEHHIAAEKQILKREDDTAASKPYDLVDRTVCCRAKFRDRPGQYLRPSNAPNPGVLSRPRCTFFRGPDVTLLPSLVGASKRSPRRRPVNYAN